MCGHTWYIGTFFSNFTVNPKLKKKKTLLTYTWYLYGQFYLFLISER